MARRVFPVQRTSRRLTEWSDILPRMFVDGITTTQTTGTAIAAESLQRQTLVRVRGSGQFRFRPAAANDVMIVGLGLIVVKEDAFSAGSTAIPSPIDDADTSWLWHRLFVPAVATQAFSATDPNQEWIENFEVDSKAQRILHPGDTIVWMADGIQSSGSPTADIAAAVRILAKLA